MPSLGADDWYSLEPIAVLQKTSASVSSGEIFHQQPNRPSVEASSCSRHRLCPGSSLQIADAREQQNLIQFFAWPQSACSASQNVYRQPKPSLLQSSRSFRFETTCSGRKHAGPLQSRASSAYTWLQSAKPPQTIAASVQGEQAVTLGVPRRKMLRLWSQLGLLPWHLFVRSTVPLPHTVAGRGHSVTCQAQERYANFMEKQVQHVQGDSCDAATPPYKN